VAEMAAASRLRRHRGEPSAAGKVCAANITTSGDVVEAQRSGSVYLSDSDRSSRRSEKPVIIAHYLSSLIIVWGRYGENWAYLSKSASGIRTAD
jgi:hypothetical protein